MTKKKNDRLAAEEILTRFPELTTKLNMGKRELTIMVRCHMVVGHFDTTKNTPMVSEASLVTLIGHANSVIQSQFIEIEVPTR